MPDSDRRRRLDERLHDLRWKLLSGSALAFTGIWLGIATQMPPAAGTSAAASAPDSASAPETPALPAAADPIQSQPVQLAPVPAATPQVTNANPAYQPLVKTRRS